MHVNTTRYLWTRCKLLTKFLISCQSGHQVLSLFLVEHVGSLSVRCNKRLLRGIKIQLLHYKSHRSRSIVKVMPLRLVFGKNDDIGFEYIIVDAYLLCVHREFFCLCVYVYSWENYKITTWDWFFLPSEYSSSLKREHVAILSSLCRREVHVLTMFMMMRENKAQVSQIHVEVVQTLFHFAMQQIVYNIEK